MNWMVFRLFDLVKTYFCVTMTKANPTLMNPIYNNGAKEQAQPVVKYFLPEHKT